MVLYKSALLLILFFCLNGIGKLYANTPSDIAVSALHQQLDNDPVWLAILGYESRGVVFRRNYSAINFSSHFLASDGRIDPRAELIATLEAFHQALLPGQNPDNHPQCIYRARYIWLDEKLAFSGSEIPSVQCNAYDEWRTADLKGLSVLFVGGFLENPASYYGHTMMKLNGPSERLTDLQNSTLNFGANISPDDGIVKYLVKGVSGRYTGAFSSAEFVHYANNYGQVEHRDIWEYELDLTESERTLMVALMWELLPAEYDYYFFNKNCAFRIAMLFSALRGIDLTSGPNLWYSPQNLISKLTALADNQRLVMGQPVYHPSRQSTFYFRYYDLNAEEQSVFRLVVRSSSEIDAERFASLPLESRHRVLDVLMDYYQYISDHGQSNVAVPDNPYNRVLAKRLVLPPGQSMFPEFHAPGPHAGRQMSYVSVSYVDNTSYGNAVRLRLRPAYYDALDYDVGHVPASALHMGDIDLLVLDGKTRVRQASLMKIESVNMRATGLPGDSRRSWLLEAGAFQERLDDPDSTVARIRGQFGYGFPLKRVSAVWGGRVGGNLQSRYQGSDYLNATLTTFFNGHIAPRVRVSLSSEFRVGVSEDSNSRRIDQVTLRYEVYKNLDVRLGYEKNVSTEISLSIGAYW